MRHVLSLVDPSNIIELLALEAGITRLIDLYTARYQRNGGASDYERERMDILFEELTVVKKRIEELRAGEQG